ncbi:acetyl-CoA carboxylase biotin carboxyl carrier protein [Microcella sp.]|uniref:acetyl-CoA carboxylase biotin carboxyl carrier protein n=1 Tax=Microcella sp. TaxID=1913979 RepID=UPI0025611246|nr:biotin/lipoyl-containing protein [Microcella sp.]MBX9472362.1 hypothetical protein [Microcella sp.]
MNEQEDHSLNNSIELSDITAIIDLLKASGWREARLRFGDFELQLSDSGVGLGVAQSAPAPVASTTPAAVSPPTVSESSTAAPITASAHEHIVRAKSLGVFWRAPQPGAPSFVEVGDEVEPDSPLAIVEVMKMMTRVEPGVRGTVTGIHVENGQVVEFDQPLLTIAML